MQGSKEIVAIQERCWWHELVSCGERKRGAHMRTHGEANTKTSPLVTHGPGFWCSYSWWVTEIWEPSLEIELNDRVSPIMCKVQGLDSSTIKIKLCKIHDAWNRVIFNIIIEREKDCGQNILVCIGPRDSMCWNFPEKPRKSRKTRMSLGALLALKL